MKACVKAWQAVVNPATGKVHDEAGRPDGKRF